MGRSRTGCRRRRRPARSRPGWRRHPRWARTGAAPRRLPGCRETGCRRRRPRPWSAWSRPAPPRRTSRGGRRRRFAAPWRDAGASHSARLPNSFTSKKFGLSTQLPDLSCWRPLTARPSWSTGEPEGRCLSSGSRVRRPTSTTRLMSPAMACSSHSNVCSILLGRLDGGRRRLRRLRSPHRHVAHRSVRDPEHAAELVERRRLAVEGEEVVERPRSSCRSRRRACAAPRARSRARRLRPG